jgi:hypothetical protein
MARPRAKIAAHQKKCINTRTVLYDTIEIEEIVGKILVINFHQ